MLILHDSLSQDHNIVQGKDSYSKVGKAQFPMQLDPKP